METINEQPVKSGMVALIGPPNVGKSTLLNNLIGQKISIVSPKPQTTRNRIAGVVNGPDYQIVLLDTPGIHQARTPLNQEMMRIALDTLSEVDVICFIVDVTLPAPTKDATLASCFENTKKPAILLLNKVDMVKKETLLPLLAAYQQLFPFSALIPISALAANCADLIITQLLKHLPTGPRLYPEDIPTDATERFIVAEMIREKIFLQTGQEVPYATAVVIDRFKEDEEKGLVTIDATIIVEKDSQKGIIIGRQGAKLKQIGHDARLEIENMLDQKVHLKLWVKVQKNWTRDPRFLKELGF